jgi:hypothetical protein
MADRVAVVPSYRLTKNYGFRLSVAFIAQSRDAARRATGPFIDNIAPPGGTSLRKSSGLSHVDNHLDQSPTVILLGIATGILSAETQKRWRR